LQALCANRNDIEIIAVDNGSEDGTAEFLQAQPGIVSILLPDNSGIASLLLPICWVTFFSAQEKSNPAYGYLLKFRGSFIA
jgi:hypothetical protein